MTSVGMLCTIDNCERVATKRGYCATCYTRLWRRGELALLPKLTLAERFWAKVEQHGPDECWLWTHGTDGAGYGNFRLNTHKVCVASRVAWTLTHGTIPSGLWVLHHCDNPPCCNPAHLFLGTCKDNNLDRDIKGRARAVVGEQHPCARLTVDTARELRHRAAHGESQRSLSRAFGISQPAVANVIHRRSWKHV